MIDDDVSQVLVVGLVQGVLHGRHAAEAVGGHVAGFAAVEEDGDGDLGLAAAEDGILLVRVGNLVAKRCQEVRPRLSSRVLAFCWACGQSERCGTPFSSSCVAKSPWFRRPGICDSLISGRTDQRNRVAAWRFGFGQGGAADAFDLPNVEVEEHRRHFAGGAAQRRAVAVEGHQQHRHCPAALPALPRISQLVLGRLALGCG